MIPLHVHSNNTFLNGTIPVEKLVQRAEQFQLPAIALTDTNSMHGVIQFSKITS
jgi:DNA polymerase-3 subunit alpha